MSEVPLYSPNIEPSTRNAKPYNQNTSPQSQIPDPELLNPFLSSALSPLLYPPDPFPSLFPFCSPKPESINPRATE